MPHISGQQPAADIEKELQAAKFAIQAKRAELPWLGNAQNGGVLRVGGDGLGYIGDFDGGTVYWSGFGAHEVHGAIRDKYNSLGAEKSYLGYPITDESSDSAGNRYNDFENGKIQWPSPEGAYTVPGITVQSAPNVTGEELTIHGGGFTPNGLVLFQVADLPGADGPKVVGLEVTASPDTTFKANCGLQFWHTQGKATLQATDQATGRVASAPIDALS